MAFSSSLFNIPSNFSINKPKSFPISATFTTHSSRTTTTSFNNKSSTNKSNSLYEVLGIQMGADTMEIKAAYRKLARLLHPDVGNCESSADEFMKLHSAYATLSDPGKRADYDRSLFLRQRINGRGLTTVKSSGYSGRRWETDQCW